jgi:excisionase family DNA binding protein
MDNLLTIQETAQRLQMSPHAVYEAVRRGVLPPGVAIHIGRRLRISGAALLQWQANGGQRLPGGWKRDVTGGEASCANGR